jgi:hypothetical protein
MTITLVDLLILALAVWRLAYMLVKEDGPYQVFTNLRKQVFLSHVLACIHCTSFWVALILYGVWLTPAYLIVYPLALSGAALMLHRYVGYHVE